MSGGFLECDHSQGSAPPAPAAPRRQQARGRTCALYSLASYAFRMALASAASSSAGAWPAAAAAPAPWLRHRRRVVASLLPTWAMAPITSATSFCPGRRGWGVGGVALNGDEALQLPPAGLPRQAASRPNVCQHCIGHERQAARRGGVPPCRLCSWVCSLLRARPAAWWHTAPAPRPPCGLPLPLPSPHHIAVPPAPAAGRAARAGRPRSRARSGVWGGIRRLLGYLCKRGRCTVPPCLAC